MRRVTIVVCALLALGSAAPAAWAQDEPSQFVLTVATTPTEAAVTVERLVEGADPEPVPPTAEKQYSVTAGKYRITVAAPDHVTDVQEIDVAADATHTVDLNHRPSAAFDVPAQAVRGEPVPLVASAEDPGGTIDSYAWDFGDGGPATDATGAQATATYTTLGAKTITLTVVDDRGAPAVASRTVTIVNRPPEAAIAVSAAPRAGQPVTLDAAGSADPDGDAITSYAWDLDDDGSFETPGAKVTRTFPTGGGYTVRLRVTDEHEATDDDSRLVVVENAPRDDAPGPVVLPGPVDAEPLADTTAPGLSVDRLGRRSLRTARRRGLRFALRCDEPCTVYLEALVGRRTARRFDLGRSTTRIGRVTTTSGSAGSKARLKFTRRARKRLADARRVKLTLQGSAWDAGGYATLYLPRKLTLRRGR